MLGLILAVSLHVCPVCGNYDAAVMIDGCVRFVHDSEDAVPGDIYSVIDDCEYDGDHWTLSECLGYIY